MRFGVNYTPSVGWFYHWLDFDLDDVRADLDSIAALGLDHVRVFPLWPVFQPNRALVRPKAVDQLLSMVDAAAERGLDVAVDGLQGHLSSFDFRPSWTLTWHRRNMFTDPEVVDGQAHYLRTLTEALRDRPNFLGMTLGNEVNQFSDKPHPDPDPVSAAGAESWLRRLLDVCAEADPRGFHSHCEYDAVWFQDGHPFTPAQAARIGAATAVHSWVFNGTAQQYGSNSVATVRHAEYQVELATGWARDPDRPVWLQEVGAPSPHIPVESAADFTGQTLDNALTCGNLWGVTWWCSHDVNRSLVDFPELEYGLGLLTSGRENKPAGLRVAETIQEWRARPTEPAVRGTALVLDVGDEDTAPNRSTCAPGGQFFDAWAALAQQGVRAAVVLASRAGDTPYLAARGITELVHPEDVR
ncbi:glycosyl hydrolase [Solihabitans fulvus]|uniref:Glycosyl hydrolase n=1 Tax=Solihabitans fulvus TaxID=1892852 RepID=A0A5B2WDI5_9PSEU|nr:glycosyl hydrolase [Solihabitans fulvus]KAA2250133.1 glycosyl hydrolase [Solihabitans fulvus]